MDTKTRRTDPLSVVVGNATLLGIGYLMQRRFNAAAAALIGTATLLVPLIWEPGTVRWPIVMGLWWVVILLESLTFCRSETREKSDRGTYTPKALWFTRISVITLVVAMLFAGYMSRGDAEDTVDRASQAHRDGECERTTATVEQLNVVHRIVAGDVVDDAAAQVEACELLADGWASDGKADTQEVIDSLTRYLDHDGALWHVAGIERARLLLERSLADQDHVGDRVRALRQIEATLSETPSLAAEATALLDFYLSGYGEDRTACRLMANAAWIADRGSSVAALDGVVAAAAAAAPVHMIDCAREHVAQGGYDAGIEQYLEFLEQYPDHELAAQVQEEMNATESDRADARELAEFGRLLASGAYCRDPIPSPHAGAFDGIANGSVWFYGPYQVESDFPEELRTRSQREATAVACVSGPEDGSFLTTCEYYAVMGSEDEVDLYTSVFEVEVYALRTGELVESYSEEIGGSCPETISYTYDLWSHEDTFPDSITARYDPKRDDLFEPLR